MNIYEFVDLTIAVTITAVLILAIKFAFRERLSPKMHKWIWIVLLAQILFFPAKELLPESNFALQTYIPSYEAQAMRGGLISALPGESEAAASDLGIAGGAGASGTVQNPQSEQSTPGQGPGVWTVLGMVWPGGALALLVLFTLRHLTFRRKYGTLPPCTDGALLALFAECKETVGVTRNIVLKTGADTAMLAGIFRPTIYLSDGYDREALRYVMIHELCHYKSRDIFLNILSVVVLCLFWFNPLVWLCFYVFRRDMEIYCDDRVVQITGDRRTYAATLLQAAVGTPFLLATSSLIAGEGETAQRIKRMAAWKKPQLWLSALVIIAAGAIAVALLLNGAPTTKTILYPVQYGGSHVTIDVPADWPAEKPTKHDGNWVFAGGKAGTETIPMSAEIHSAIATAQSARYGTLADTAELAEKTDIVNHIKEHLPGTVQELTVMEGYDWSGAVGKYFSGTTEKAGKRYNWAIGVGWEIYTIWAEEEEASQAELLEIMQTAKYLQRPEEGILTPGEGMLTSAGGYSGYVLDEIDGNIDRAAEKLLGDYLAAYESKSLPLELVTKGYEIHSLVPVEIAEDSPLAVIYPNAYVYKADYELKPKYENFYNYDAYNGSDFKVTESGGQRYREKYLLFAENVYLDKSDAPDTHAFYFVGFLSGAQGEYSSGISESKLKGPEEQLDLLGYQWADVWYDVEIRRNIGKLLQSDYLGDVGKTSKIIRALPLYHLMDTSEGMYRDQAEDRGAVLLTAAEPYGLILNYNIPAFDTYIHERSIADAGILSNTIGNLGQCTIRLHYEDERGRVVRDMAFELEPGFGVNLSKMKITETIK